MPGCLQQSGLACLSDVTLRSYRYVLFELSDTRLGLQGSGLYGMISAVALVVLAIFFLMTLNRDARKLRVTEDI